MAALNAALISRRFASATCSLAASPLVMTVVAGAIADTVVPDRLPDALAALGSPALTAPIGVAIPDSGRPLPSVLMFVPSRLDTLATYLASVFPGPVDTVNSAVRACPRSLAKLRMPRKEPCRIACTSLAACGGMQYNLADFSNGRRVRPTNPPPPCRHSLWGEIYAGLVRSLCAFREHAIVLYIDRCSGDHLVVATPSRRVPRSRAGI